MKSVPRILTHLPIQLLEPVARAHPDIEIVPIGIDETPGEDTRGDVLLTLPWHSPNLAAVIERDVRWVHAYGTGVNGFPFELIGERQMTCSRGASATAISEWVIAVLLAAEKQLPQTWLQAPPEQWNFARLGSLEDRKLALVGFGGIGRAVARRALPFGMRIEALRRTDAASPVDGVRIVTSLESLLRDADHVVVAAPETPASRHMINDAAFSSMKPSAHLVNVARGGLVDQNALRRALDGDRLALATLDCVDPEPLPEGHWLYSHPRVRLTPHISWAAPSSHLGLIERFVENLGRYRRGEPLEGIVDIVEGY